ncbi:MAG: hypothetical protein ABF381_11890 [Akkermansiaceae bacterium]
MKSTILSLAVFATILTSLITKSQTATEDFDPLGEINDLPKLIRVQAEFIEMPHATYTKLMANPRRNANDTDLRAECAKLVSTGDAGILETMSVIALPGQNASSKSVAEYIYPTEYEPGQIPETVERNVSKSLASPPLPTAFDVRNTGSTFEVEALIDHTEKFVELRFAPNLVYHIENINWGADKVDGAAGPVEMPRFYSLSVKTGATLMSGQPAMIAALSPKNDKGITDSTRKIMLFLRADVLTIGK